MSGEAAKEPVPAGPRARSAASATLPLPAGFRLSLDGTTKRIDDRTLFGGVPARVLRLSGAGQGALDEILAGAAESAGARTLGRRLIDRGLAHPVPPRAPALTVTVLIPVRDRAAELDRCLAALGAGRPVVVVDDGSADPGAIARVCTAHGARLVRREHSGGPAAARNEGLALIDTDVVAFLDSDCVPPPRWIEPLLGHFADPMVALVAPRIVALDAGGALGRYHRARSCLDLGRQPARVAPNTAVAYVPTAAVLARVTALRDVAVSGVVFDAALRYGEDVDLVWRLHAAGWRLRYDPSASVGHEEPKTWRTLLARRFRYGTSAGPLSRRHPAETVPLMLPRWPAAAVAATIAGRPVVGAAAFAAGVATLRRSLNSAGLPGDDAVSVTGRRFGHVWLGVGRYLTQFAAPAVAALVLSRRVPTRTRLALLALVLSPAVKSALRVGPRQGAATQLAAHLADDMAYGTGVWAGCVHNRTLRPLLPKF